MRSVAGGYVDGDGVPAAVSLRDKPLEFAFFYLSASSPQHIPWNARSQSSLESEIAACRVAAGAEVR
jgi:hypothetical protein